MSDNSISIVDIDASAEEAPALAALVVKDLIARGIILPELTDCTLGDSGHPPGPNFNDALVKRYETLDGLAVNGLEVVAERNVFFTAGNGIQLVCAACLNVFEPSEDYAAAVDAWYKHEGSPTFPCSRCRYAPPIEQWDGPYAFGLGNLGLTFWNWPPLKPAFIESVKALLGHRTRLVLCHI